MFSGLLKLEIGGNLSRDLPSIEEVDTGWIAAERSAETSVANVYRCVSCAGERFP